MRDNNQDQYLQPIFSTAGIFVSLLSAISPIFSYSPITSLFIFSDLAPFAGFVAFMMSFIAIWTLFEPYRFINHPLGKFTDRGRGYNEPKFYINSRNLVLILFFVAILLSLIFLYIKTLTFQTDFNPSYMLGFAQLVIYIVFFIVLVSVFTLLITTTLDRFKYQQQRDEFTWTVFSTLEKNKLVSTGIEFYENVMLPYDEASKHGIIGAARKITVRTIPQEKTVIKCILSHDGRELLKIVEKDNRE